MFEHTPEPWQKVIVEHGPLMGTSALVSTAVHYGPIGHIRFNPVVSAAENEANARRIVACVNALTGIPTDMLELVGANMLELVGANDYGLW